MNTVRATVPERDALLETGKLSTDYLNRYNEALMLLEMAATDPSLAADLSAWRPVGYIDHFLFSQLRCSTGAIAAYRSLPANSRAAFEQLCAGMDRLVKTVVEALHRLADPADAVYVIDIAVDSLKSLLARATAFINTGGDLTSVAFDESELQIAVDHIIED